MHAGDVVLIVVAMGLAIALHSLLVDWVPWLRKAPGEVTLLLVAYVALPIWIIVLSLSGLDRVLEGGLNTLHWSLRLLRAQVFATGILLAVIWSAQLVVNRSLVVLFIVFSFLLPWTSRFMLALWARHQYSSGHGRTRMLLVGSASECRRLAEQFEASPMPPLISGSLQPDSDPGEAPSTSPVLGPPERIDDVLHEHAIDVVLIAPPYERWADAKHVVERCEERGISVEFTIPAADGGLRMARVSRRFGAPVITYAPPYKPPEWLALKQLFDTSAAAIGIVLLTPIWLLVGALVLLSSGRPILFKQERIGKNGRRFYMLKFRTMVKDAELQKGNLQHRNEAGGPVFKLGDDPRVTRVGRLLRRSSIDELPQLFNVLGGSMSLIGPRPLPVEEQQNIRGPRRRRLAMKPGITGLWQVSGRSNVTFERWMDLDLQYVDEWRPSLDVLILLRTIPAVLFGRGAH